MVDDVTVRCGEEAHSMRTKCLAKEGKIVLMMHVRQELDIVLAEVNYRLLLRTASSLYKLVC